MLNLQVDRQRQNPIQPRAPLVSWPSGLIKPNVSRRLYSATGPSADSIKPLLCPAMAPFSWYYHVIVQVI